MGTVNSGMFTSETNEWPTPGELFAALDAEFGFDLDPCATAENAKCARFYTEADDGLTQPWDGTVFMNPPYGRQIGDWMRKAADEAERGATVVCLIPSRTDTAYWHETAMRASELRFIRGRLHFANARHADRVADGRATAHNAPFPSVIVVFRPGHLGAPQVSAIDRQGREVQS